MKTIILLGLLLSISLNAETITFKQLAKLVSSDIGKNIYLDKMIEDYTVDINIHDHQKKGEIYAFFTNVLFDYNLELSRNEYHDYYTVESSRIKKPKIQDPKPIPAYHDTQYYYTYKVRNITNKDVKNVMSIFPQSVKYTYLEQSDMIAYSATKKLHNQIKKILINADNTVLSKTVKISIFAIRKNDLLEYGTSFNEFQFDFDGSIQKVFDSLTDSIPATVNFNSLMSANFTMRALQVNGLADIFQQPTIMLTNGHKSDTNVVLKIPYLKTTSQVDSTTNTTVEQYDYTDVGLQIKILPKIKDDWIYLDLDLVLAEVISNDDFRPITQEISFKNSLIVKDNKPVLLTGVQKIFQKEEIEGIPLLSDIPYLGKLFEFSSKTKEEQNINILIEVL